MNPAPPGALAGALPPQPSWTPLTPRRSARVGATNANSFKWRSNGAQGALPLEPRPAEGPGRGLATPTGRATASSPATSTKFNSGPTCAYTDTGKDSPAGRRRTSLAARCAARSSKVRRRACQQQPESSLANVGPSQASPSCQVRQNEFEQNWRASVRVGDTPPTPLPPAAWQGPCLPAGPLSSTSSRGRRACRGSSAQTILEPPPRLPRSSDRRAPLCGRSGRWYERRVAKARRAGCNCARNRSY